MSWIQPLELKTIIIQIFAGSPEIFGALAILVIAGFAGYFRMNGITMFFMLGIFVLMFSEYIGTTFITLFAILGGLLIGYWLSRLIK